MRASAITKTLVAASANAIAASQSLGAAGFLTLTASPVVLDTQRRIILTSAGNDAGLTWTVIGTAEGGQAIKDVFAGANGVAQSNLNFLTITSIFGSGATASTVTAGTNGVGSSPWKIFGDTVTPPDLGIYMNLATGGSGNATFEYTQDEFLDPIGIQSAIAFAPATVNPIALPHPDLQSLTASKDGSLNWEIHAWRLTINSGTGTWKCTARQAGLASP